MDTPILIAGIVAVAFMFVVTIIFICKGYSIKISFMGESEVLSAKEVSDGGKLSVTFSFIMLWISSLATALLEDDFKETVKSSKDKTELMNYILKNMEEEN